MSRVWFISFSICSHPPFGCRGTLLGYHATVPSQISRHTGPDDVRHKCCVVYLLTNPSTSTLADDVRCDSTFRSSTCCCIQLRVRLSHVCCNCHCHHCSPSNTEVPYRTKFRLTKFFGGQNFRYQVEISAVLSDEIFSSVSNFPKQFTRKICFNMKFVLIWHVLYFSGLNISADKNFRRTKFSAASQIYLVLGPTAEI